MRYAKKGCLQGFQRLIDVLQHIGLGLRPGVFAHFRQNLRGLQQAPGSVIQQLRSGFPLGDDPDRAGGLQNAGVFLLMVFRHIGRGYHDGGGAGGAQF